MKRIRISLSLMVSFPHTYMQNGFILLSVQCEVADIPFDRLLCYCMLLQADYSTHVVLLSTSLARAIRMRWKLPTSIVFEVNLYLN